MGSVGYGRRARSAQRSSDLETVEVLTGIIFVLGCSRTSILLGFTNNGPRAVSIDEAREKSKLSTIASANSRISDSDQAASHGSYPPGYPAPSPFTLFPFSLILPSPPHHLPLESSPLLSFCLLLHATISLESGRLIHSPLLCFPLDLRSLSSFPSEALVLPLHRHFLSLPLCSSLSFSACFHRHLFQILLGPAHLAEISSVIGPSGFSTSRVSDILTSVVVASGRLGRPLRLRRSNVQLSISRFTVQRWPPSALLAVSNDACE